MLLMWVLIYFVCESDQLLLRPRLDHVSLPASAAAAADREMRRDGGGPASHLGSLALHLGSRELALCKMIFKESLSPILHVELQALYFCYG